MKAKKQKTKQNLDIENNIEETIDNTVKEQVDVISTEFSKIKNNKKLKKLDLENKIKINKNILNTYIKNSAILYVNTVTNDNIENNKKIIQNNLQVFDLFNKIVIINNLSSDTDDNIMYEYSRWLISTIGSKCEVIIDEVSREGGYGEIDMVKIGYEYLRTNYPEIEYIMKISNNILLNKNIVNLKIDKNFMCLPYLKSDDIRFLFKNTEDKKGQLTKITQYIENFDNVDVMYNTEIFIFKNGTFDFIYDEMVKLREEYEKDLKNDIFFISKEESLVNTIKRNKIKPSLMFDNSYMIKFFNKVISDNMLFGPNMENIDFSDYGLCNKKFYSEKVVKI